MRNIPALRNHWPILPATVVLLVVTLTAGIFSNATPASAQVRTPPATNIQVVNGHNPGEVIISWDAVPAATHYRIGYVNMDTDYPLAKSTEGGRTGNWLEAFVYVDVEAQNFVTSGTVYTIRRLEQGVRHAFVVLTNGSAYGEPTWPTTSPIWKFLVVTDQGGACPSVAPTTVAPTSCVADGTCLPIREIGRVIGTGDSTEHVFDLQAGLYRFTLTGDYLVSADLVATTAGRNIFYFDYIGRDEQSAQELVTVDADDAGTFVLEIDAGGDSWQFDIVRIGG